MRRRRVLRLLGSGGAAGSLDFVGRSAASELPKPKIGTSFASPKDIVSGLATQNNQLWVTINYKDGNGNHYIVSKDGITQDTFSIPHPEGRGKNGVAGIALGSDVIHLVGFRDNDDRYRPRLFVLDTDRTLKRRLKLQTRGSPRDAVRVDSYTWICTHDRIQQLDAAGNIRQSLQARPDTQAQLLGLAHDGTHFWVAYTDRIVQFDTAGKIQAQFAYPRGGQPGCGYGYCEASLAHDGDVLWLARQDKGNVVALNTSVGSTTPTSTATPTAASTPDSQSTDTPSSQPPRDTDGDGVRNTEDYAPRDPAIQDESDYKSGESDTDSGGGLQPMLMGATALLGGLIGAGVTRAIGSNSSDPSSDDTGDSGGGPGSSDVNHQSPDRPASRQVQETSATQPQSRGSESVSTPTQETGNRDEGHSEWATESGAATAAGSVAGTGTPVEVHNETETELRCRVRCRTDETIVFDETIAVAPTDVLEVGTVETEDPVEVGVALADGSATEVIHSPLQTNTVTISLRSGAVEIS